MSVNCASIPETLIESELFGYEEGAFTGARKKGAIGKILQANGGTLFLDEIGDMPKHLQARLLRVLQERKVSPLGSTRGRRGIVSATHKHLKVITRGDFREDLYYRLNGWWCGCRRCASAPTSSSCAEDRQGSRVRKRRATTSARRGDGSLQALTTGQATSASCTTCCARRS